MAIRVRLTRLGVWKDPDSIEPSCGVLDMLRGSEILRRVVVDYGAIPVNGDEGTMTSGHIAPDLSFFEEDGKKIDVLCGTHAHDDHIGLLPALTPYLSNDAFVLATVPTAATMEHTWIERIRIRTKRGLEPPFDIFQYYQILERLEKCGGPIARPGKYDIAGLPVWVDPRAHINGAAMFEFQIGKTFIAYLGDGCSFDQPGVRGAPLLPKERYPHIIAGSDCTYGADRDSDKRTWSGEMDRGYDACAEAVKRGHPALWFTFGLHRSTALGHEMQRRGLPDIAPVFLDGSGRQLSEILTSKHGRWCELDTPYDISKIGHVRGFRHRQEILELGGFTVITTPGMGGPGGAGTFWRRHILPAPGAVAIFTGYVAAGTDGAKILEADRKRRETGKEETVTLFSEEEDEDGVSRVVKEEIPLRCKIAHIRAGSHDSRGKILEEFRTYRPEVLVLSHGSHAALQSLEQELKSEIPHVFRADKTRSVELEL